MSFFPDFDSFGLDIYFLMSCYLMLGSGERFVDSPQYVNEVTSRGITNRNDLKYMFPGLVKSGGNNLVTQLISQCKGNVDGVPTSGNYSGKSLRSGGLQEVVVRTGGNKAAGVFRGGWWLNEYEHTHNEYMSGCYPLLTISGLAIRGFPKGTENCNVPKCDVILLSMSIDESITFMNFIKELYKSQRTMFAEYKLEIWPGFST